MRDDGRDGERKEETEFAPKNEVYEPRRTVVSFQRNVEGQDDEKPRRSLGNVAQNQRKQSIRQRTRPLLHRARTTDHLHPISERHRHSHQNDDGPKKLLPSNPQRIRDHSDHDGRGEEVLDPSRRSSASFQLGEIKGSQQGRVEQMKRTGKEEKCEHQPRERERTRFRV